MAFWKNIFAEAHTSGMQKKKKKTRKNPTEKCLTECPISHQK